MRIQEVRKNFILGIGYFDGAWWNVDITYDITNTVTGRNLYGFHRLESVSADDEAYFITKIY